VRSQFLLLVELQQLDDGLRALDLEQKKLPQQLQRYEAVCHEARQQLTQLHTEIEQSVRQQRTLERELDSHQATLSKIQGKLHEIKTNKEYSAVLAEIATWKQRIEGLEDHLLQLMELTDQQRQARQLQEQRVQAAEQDLNTRGLQVQQAQAGLAQRLAVDYDKRQQTTVHIEGKLYETYEKLAAQHGGRAVAQLHDGVCGGCHLKVPPQLVSQIRMQEQLFHCPHCQLMLLWPA
jgi:predicted  nucleic acid-binding Zn-ribbon protein